MGYNIEMLAVTVKWSKLFIESFPIYFCLYHLSCQSLFLMEIDQWIHHCCFFAFQSSNSMRLSN